MTEDSNDNDDNNNKSVRRVVITTPNSHDEEATQATQEGSEAEGKLMQKTAVRMRP
jgi:hypothetical protein